jgi:hypothetical protein
MIVNSSSHMLTHVCVLWFIPLAICRIGMQIALSKIGYDLFHLLIAVL